MTCSTAKLNDLPFLSSRLKSYALVSGAAAVACMAVPSAAAQVVYTPADITLMDGNVPIDLDANTFIDVTLNDSFRAQGGGSNFIHSRRLRIRGMTGAGVVAHGDAVPLPLGTPIGIGGSQNFTDFSPGKYVLMARDGVYGCGSSCGGIFGTGPWINVTKMYLGLKFQISGETHYAWAEISTKAKDRAITIQARLTGFAYEAVANQPIMAGQTQEGTPPAATLADLARGK